MATVKQQFYTVAGLNKALRALPKQASAKLRDASVEIADEIASEARSKGSSAGGAMAAYVAPTFKATRDRIPVIKMGSSKRINGRKGKRQTVGDLIWGAEFGGRGRPTTQQFLPHKGTTGYVLYPTVRENRQDIWEAYSDALLDAVEDI